MALAMAIYSVFTREGEPEPQAVPDRFSWLAALLPPIHALVHGLWLWFGLCIAAVAGLIGIGFVIGADAAFWLYLLFALFIGFEAGALRRASLVRRHYVHRGERVAPDEETAALSWLAPSK